MRDHWNVRKVQSVPTSTEHALVPISLSSYGICSVMNRSDYGLNRNSADEQRSRRDHRVPG
jgi:hypothetical protein